MLLGSALHWLPSRGARVPLSAVTTEVGNGMTGSVLPHMLAGIGGPHTAEDLEERSPGTRLPKKREAAPSLQLAQPLWLSTLRLWPCCPASFLFSFIHSPFPSSVLVTPARTQHRGGSLPSEILRQVPLAHRGREGSPAGVGSGDP